MYSLLVLLAVRVQGYLSLYDYCPGIFFFSLGMLHDKDIDKV